MSQHGRPRRPKRKDRVIEAKSMGKTKTARPSKKRQTCQRCLKRPATETEVVLSKLTNIAQKGNFCKQCKDEVEGEDDAESVPHRRAEGTVQLDGDILFVMTDEGYDALAMALEGIAEGQPVRIKVDVMPLAE